MAFVWSELTVPTSGGTDVLDYIWDSGHAQLVAVGATGLVYTTPDLVTVTKQVASENNNWRGLAYAPTLGTAGRLCAVASNGVNRVMTSDDGGVTWTARAASAANQWQAVVWAAALTLFVAVSSTGAADGSTSVMTSADGIAWTTRAAINPRQAWTGVTWSPSLALLVAASGTNGTVAVGGVVMTSTNGTAWTQQNALAGVNATVSGGVQSGSNYITWDVVSGLFAGSCLAAGVRQVLTSPNGTAWTQQTIPNNTDANGGLIGFPAVGLVLFRQNAGNDNVNMSLNGSTWTTTNVGFNRSFNTAGKIESLNKIVSWGSANTIMLVGRVASFDSLAPAVGTKRGGTLVTLTGTGFTGVTSVTFGGTAAVSVIVASDTSIICVTPPHAVGLVDVVVTGIGTLTNAFSFVSVDRVSPKTGTVAGSTPVTITGYGFNAATGVLFDATAATSVVLDPVTPNLKLTAVTPAHASGVVDVTVSGVDTGPALYTYTLPVPQLQGKGPLLPPIPTRTPLAGIA